MRLKTTATVPPAPLFSPDFTGRVRPIEVAINKDNNKEIKGGICKGARCVGCYALHGKKAKDKKHNQMAWLNWN